jgi:DnaJ-class molecular chaperone
MDPGAARIESRRISVAELGNTWHVILGVPAEATAVEIEAAYHARLAEYDRIRFAPDETALSKQTAEAARARLTEAYEFIRQARH